MMNKSNKNKKLNYRYKTTEEFVKKAIAKHGNKYDYSLVDYVNAKTKVKIICPIHGKFEQIPRAHINGGGCPKCHGKSKTTEDIVTEFIKKHGNKYDYSLVVYKNNLTTVDIICPIHGVFRQRPKDHLMGKGCQKCSGVYMDTNYFIEKAEKKHNNYYSYDKTVFIKSDVKTTITCPKHGDFEQTPNSHLNGRGCPICRESKGEKEIRLNLLKNKITFLPQYKFINCKNKQELPFDFYLPDHNTCIEFHGEQHYKAFKHFGGKDKFEKTKYNDFLKLKFCNDNKINLIIINDIKTIYNCLQPIFVS